MIARASVMARAVEQKNVPALRFSEFKGAWEEKRLGNVCKVNPKANQLPEKFFYIDLESVVAGSLGEVVELAKEKAPSRAQRVVSKGDVLFQLVRPSQRNNLFFNIDGTYVASTGYAQIRAKKNSAFIFYILHSDHFVTAVLKRCTGTSYPSINTNDLAEISISLPDENKEQQKIADFLTVMDVRLKALRRKRDLLEDYTRGVMQQIFSQQIRFKTDRGSDFPDWEEVPIGDLVTRNPSQITEHSLDGEVGKFPVYGASGITQRISFFQEAKPYIGIVKDGAGVGRLMLCKGHSSTIGTVDRLLPKREFCAGFIFYLLSQVNFQRLVMGSTIPHLYFRDYKNTELEIPSKLEREKISNFLTVLNEKINATSNQIYWLKTFKNGLLQNMFM